MITLSRPTIMALVGVLIGILLTVFGFSILGEQTPSAITTNEQPLYWVAPMDPSYRRDKPGKSPMGMALVPVYDMGGNDELGTVRIDPAMTNNLGVRTAHVVRGKLHTHLRGVGYVQYNPETLVQIAPRVQGWVEQLFVAADGEYIEKGDALYSLYSPELVNAQEELVLALNRGNKNLIHAANRRLSALQISDDFIAQLRKNKRVQRAVVFTAPQAGFISELKVLPGAHVEPSNTLMMIANLDDVWVEVELLERQASLVREGMDATMQLVDTPDKARSGKVEYVYPTIDPKTRTVKVRLRFSNTDHVIKPNMFATVFLAEVASQESLLVPREALIRTANQTRVVLALGEGKFRSVVVEVGRISDDTAQITDGLEEGNRVVTSAQFLIDSESNKSAEMARMSAGDTVKMSTTMMSDSAQENVWTTATVTKVMLDMGMVELSHEPIEAWSWPAMTMSFSASQAAAIYQLNVGDKILAQLSKNESSGYRLLKWQQQTDGGEPQEQESGTPKMPSEEQNK